MASISCRGRGQFTIPEELQIATRSDGGDMPEADKSTQGWFWTPEWQKGEQEAEADRRARRVKTFASGEDFLDALTRRGKCESD